MEHKEVDVVALVKKLWQSKRGLIQWGLIGFGIGVVIAISIPRSYRTEILIAPEVKGGSSSMGNMGALAGMMGVNIGGAGASQGIDQDIYPKILESTPFLMEFYDMQVQKISDPKGAPILLRDYLEKDQKQTWWSYIFQFPGTVIGWIKGGKDDQTTAVEESSTYIVAKNKHQFTTELSRLIETKEDKESGILAISSEFQDPLIAAQVADSVLCKLQHYMTTYYTRKTRNELENIERAFFEAKQKYNHLEAQYAAIQDRNQNLITKSSQIKVEQLSNERNIAFSVYQQLSTQLEMTKIKLLEQTPIATVIEPSRVNERPHKPNKILIVMALTFLFALGYVGKVVVGELAKK